MERSTTTMLRIGAWCVNPASGEISRNGESVRVEARAMRLLVCLADHAGQVVSIDDLLSQVWSGVFVNPDSVYQAVASLRRLLGDDSKQPTYIATVPRLGYRMVATVSSWVDPPITRADSRTSDSEHSALVAVDAPASGTNRTVAFLWVAVGGLCFAVIFGFLFRGKISNTKYAAPSTAPQDENSIAVLPFLDLTDTMNEEPFADGLTEELIDKLSRISGLRVPSATSSFYFKGKLWPRSHGSPQMTIADIAKTLGVAYVLDGSIRKSGDNLRVAARLVRADNGFIVWSETYDRRLADILMVQDDIASDVAKELRASIKARPDS